MSSLGLFTLFFSQLRYSRGIVARPGGAPSKPTRSLVKSRLSIRSLVLPEIADQIVGGTVMRQRWFRFALDLRNDPLRQHFPQLDAPLIKRVDAPDRALGKNGVFVKSDQRAEDFRCQALCQNRVRRTIALKHAVGTSRLGVPSAFTCSGVLPNAKASVCAQTLATSMSWCLPSGLSASAKPMKSQGINLVP